MSFRRSLEYRVVNCCKLRKLTLEHTPFARRFSEHLYDENGDIGVKVRVQVVHPIHNVISARLAESLQTEINYLSPCSKQYRVAILKELQK